MGGCAEVSDDTNKSESKTCFIQTLIERLKDTEVSQQRERSKGLLSAPRISIINTAIENLQLELHLRKVALDAYSSILENLEDSNTVPGAETQLAFRFSVNGYEY